MILIIIKVILVTLKVNLDKIDVWLEHVYADL